MQNNSNINLNSFCPFCFGQKGYSNICPHCGYEEKISPLSNHLRPRTVLNNRYIIGAVIGVGGFSIVYKAYDTNLNRIIAVKELFPPLLVNRIAGQNEVIVTSSSNIPQFNYMLNRFRVEVNSLSKLVDHPNIVSIYDCVTENNTAYIIMEYLVGETLHDHLRRLAKISPAQAKLSPAQAQRIAIDVLSALSAVHSRGIVNRDIKPSNIYLCSDGSIKLIDFGAAKYAALPDDPSMICSKIYTDGFAPPEQYRDNKEQGVRTDIYAVGATMYCMLTSFVPPPSPDIEKKLIRLTPPIKLASNITDNMNRAVLKAMSVDQRLRFSSAEKFKKTLEKNRRVRTDDEELVVRKRRRITAAVSLLLLVCMAVLGGWYYLSQLRNSDSSQVMLLDDEAISVYVCVDDEEQEQAQAVYDTIESGFAEYAAGVTDHNIEVSVECIPEREFGSVLDAADDAAVLMCGGSGFENPSEGDWLDSLLDSSYMFERSAANGFMTTFDVDILYINKKLLNDTGADAALLNSVEGIMSIGEVVAAPGLFGTYDSFTVSESALADFCDGRIMFCAAKVSDIQMVSQALPGYYQAVAIPGGKICAGGTDVWHINGDASENQQHAAELFLSYLAGDEAQDILCLQNQNGIPTDADIYQLYINYHPELYSVLDDRSSYTFG